MWKLESSSAQTLRMDFTVKYEVSSSWPFEIKSICIFLDYGLFDEGEGADVIFKDFNKIIELFYGKTISDMFGGDL